MACRTCNGVAAVLARYPAGDPKGSLKATGRAAAETERTGQAAHVHYVPATDEYVVVVGKEPRR